MTSARRGWSYPKLKDVIQYKKGKKPKILSGAPDSDFLPYVDIKAFEKGIILKYAHKEDGVQAEPEDTLMVWDGARSGLVGRGVKGVIGSTLARIVPKNDKVDKDYLYYFLLGKFSYINANMKGTGIPHVDPAKLWDLDFPHPSIEGQKHIVNMLSSTLGKVEDVRARLDKVPSLLNYFRKTVLEQATTGDLTEDFSATATSNWQETELINLILAKPRNGKSPKGVAGPTPYRNLTLSSITQGTFIEGCFKYVNLDIDSSSYLWVKNGDLLIQRANSIDYVGVSALYEGEDDKYVYPDLMMKCRANSKVLPKYLHLALSSERVRKYFRDNATGTAGNMPKINQAIVSAAPICYPALDEQAEIVRKVGELLELANAVERKYNAAKLRVDKLTQSILARAFRGELFEPFSDKVERVALPQSSVSIDERLTAAEETALEQLDKSPAQSQPTLKAVDDKSKLLFQLNSAKKAMSAQQLFDSASVQTFKAIDELFVELKRLLELKLIEKLGEGESCQFRAMK